MTQRLAVTGIFTTGIILMFGINSQPALAKVKRAKQQSPPMSYAAAYDQFTNSINMTHDDLVVSVHPTNPLIVTITLHQKSVNEMKRIGSLYYKKYRALRIRYNQPVAPSECWVIVNGPNVVTGPTIITNANGSRVGS